MMDSFEQKSFFSGLTDISKFFITAFIAVIIIGTFVILSERDEGSVTEENELSEKVKTEEEIADSEGPSDKLLIRDQEAGDVVLVSELKLADSRWVVIHEDADGEPGNILGARLFSADETTGEVELLRGTEEGELYHAILYKVAERETGQDRLFDSNIDLPLANEEKDAEVFSFETF